ncbi:hypothetical protein [Novosphingobium sp. P6W]|nr:hypothetical protein [Novosphingobium sp. P6W]
MKRSVRPSIVADGPDWGGDALSGPAVLGRSASDRGRKVEF